MWERSSGENLAVQQPIYMEPWALQRPKDGCLLKCVIYRCLRNISNRTFGLASAPACVEDEQRVLGRDPLHGASGGCLCRRLVPPDWGKGGGGRRTESEGRLMICACALDVGPS
jgi:hypothetical protein